MISCLYDRIASPYVHTHRIYALIYASTSNDSIVYHWCDYYASFVEVEPN